jgi:two-component system sensor histidine kinase VicK
MPWSIIRTQTARRTRRRSPHLRQRQAGNSVACRRRCLLAQGWTILPVEYVACPLLENGHVDGIVVAFTDVTERRRLDRMKDEFIATVSHELRTPLTSLRAALGLVASGALEKRPEKIPQMLDIALATATGWFAWSMTLSTSSALAAAVCLCTRANGMPLTCCGARWIRSDRAPPARASLSASTRSRSMYGWTAIASCRSGQPDPQCDQVFREGRRDPSGARASSEKEVTFEVQDQGQGIPAEKLDLIFDRFQQADASDSRLQGGTGLGLALCRGIINQHGGRIWAKSNPGSGSTFYFTVEQ